MKASPMRTKFKRPLKGNAQLLARAAHDASMGNPAPEGHVPPQPLPEADALPIGALLRRGKGARPPPVTRAVADAARLVATAQGNPLVASPDNNSGFRHVLQQGDRFRAAIPPGVGTHGVVEPALHAAGLESPEQAALVVAMASPVAPELRQAALVAAPPRDQQTVPQALALQEDVHRGLQACRTLQREARAKMPRLLAEAEKVDLARTIRAIAGKHRGIPTRRAASQAIDGAQAALTKAAALQELHEGGKGPKLY